MAIGVRGSAENSAVNAGDITITFPGGVAADDYVLVTAGNSQSSAAGGDLAFSTSGYTELLNRDAGAKPPTAGGKAEILVGRKLMGGTPDSTVVVVNGHGAFDATAGVLIIYTGVNTTTPEDATTTDVGGASGQPDSLTITTATDGARVVSCVSSFQSDTTVTAPSGYANQIDRNSADTRSVTVGMADIVKTTAGDEEPPAWSTFATSTSWSAGTVAIRPAGGAGAFTLTAAAGSYALTGTAATLKAARLFAAGAGSYALTGSAATLVYGHPMVAGAGSYALTGTDASLEFGAKLSATAGAYALTGSDASLELGALVSAAAGSYALTGTTASLLRAALVSADSGSYALTGSDATLSTTGAVVVPADTGVGGGTRWPLDTDTAYRAKPRPGDPYWRRKRDHRIAGRQYDAEEIEAIRAAAVALVRQATERRGIDVTVQESRREKKRANKQIEVDLPIAEPFLMPAYAPSYMTDDERSDFRMMLEELSVGDRTIEDLLKPMIWERARQDAEEEELLLMTPN